MEVSVANWLRWRRLANAVPWLVCMIQSDQPGSTAPKYCTQAMLALSSAASSQPQATVATKLARGMRCPPTAHTSKNNAQLPAVPKRCSMSGLGPQDSGLTQGKAIAASSKPVVSCTFTMCVRSGAAGDSAGCCGSAMPQALLNKGCRVLCLPSNTSWPSSICTVMPKGLLANTAAR